MSGDRTGRIVHIDRADCIVTIETEDGVTHRAALSQRDFDRAVASIGSGPITLEYDWPARATLL